MRTSVKNLEEHQNIVSKQTHKHRPARSGTNKVSRDSDTTPLQTELSCSISQHVERAYNVIIFNLAESLHDLKQHDCNLIDKLCEFILNRKVNVSFTRLGPKPDSNSSMSP